MDENLWYLSFLAIFFSTSSLVFLSWMEDIVLSQLFSRKSLSSSVMREEVRRDSTVMFSSRSRDFRKSASLLLKKSAYRFERGVLFIFL